MVLLLLRPEFNDQRHLENILWPHRPEQVQAIVIRLGNGPRVANRRHKWEQNRAIDKHLVIGADIINRAISRLPIVCRYGAAMPDRAADLDLALGPAIRTIERNRVSNDLARRLAYARLVNKRAFAQCD